MLTKNTTEAEGLERAIHEAIRAIALQLDDLRAAVERLRQLRHRDDYLTDHRLMIEHGPNGRPEVVR